MKKILLKILLFLPLILGCERETITVEVPVEVPAPAPRVTLVPLLFVDGRNDFVFVYGTAGLGQTRFPATTEFQGYWNYADFNAKRNPRFWGVGGIGFFSAARLAAQQIYLGLDSLQTDTMRAGITYRHFVRGQSFVWNGETIWYDWRIVIGVGVLQKQGILKKENGVLVNVETSSSWRAL